MANYIKVLVFSISLLFFSACVPSQNNIKSVFQTNSATTIKKDQERLQSLLSKFKSKLDKRNPKTFSKRYERRIYSLINGTEGKFFLKHNNVTLVNYKDYLQFAFSEDDISLRN